MLLLAERPLEIFWLFSFFLTEPHFFFRVTLSKYQLLLIDQNMSFLSPLIQCLKLFGYSPCFLPMSQVRAADEMNYDFQALALESRGMGEVRGFPPNVCLYSITVPRFFYRKMQYEGANVISSQNYEPAHFRVKIMHYSELENNRFFMS